MKSVRIFGLSIVIAICLVLTIMVLNNSLNETRAHEQQIGAQAQLQLLEELFKSEESHLKNIMVYLYKRGAKYISTKDQPFKAIYLQTESLAEPFWQIYASDLDWSESFRNKLFNKTISAKSNLNEMYSTIKGNDKSQYLLISFPVSTNHRKAYMTGVLPVRHYSKFLKNMKNLGSVYIFNRNKVALLHNEVDFIGVALSRNRDIQKILKSNSLRGEIKGDQEERGVQTVYVEIKKNQLWAMVKKEYSTLTVAQNFIYFVPFISILIFIFIFIYAQFEGQALRLKKESDLDGETIKTSQPMVKEQIVDLKEKLQIVEKIIKNEPSELKKSSSTLERKTLLGNPSLPDVFEVSNNESSIEEVCDELVESLEGILKSDSPEIKKINAISESKESIQEQELSSRESELPIYDEDELEAYLKGLKIDLKDGDGQVTIRKPKIVDLGVDSSTQI